MFIISVLNCIQYYTMIAEGFLNCERGEIYATKNMANKFPSSNHKTI